MSFAMPHYFCIFQLNNSIILLSNYIQLFCFDKTLWKEYASTLIHLLKLQINFQNPNRRHIWYKETTFIWKIILHFGYILFYSRLLYILQDLFTCLTDISLTFFLQGACAVRSCCVDNNFVSFD